MGANTVIGPTRVCDVKGNKGHTKGLRALNIFQLIINEQTAGER